MHECMNICKLFFKKRLHKAFVVEKSLPGNVHAAHVPLLRLDDDRLVGLARLRLDRDGHLVLVLQCSIKSIQLIISSVLRI